MLERVGEAGTALCQLRAVDDATTFRTQRHPAMKTVSSDVSAVPSPRFTPLHRWLGRENEPLSIELLDAAVNVDLEEKSDLDFKLTSPSAAKLSQSDLAKDIAAMANSGGGMLLFGIRDSSSRASEAPRDLLGAYA